MSSSGVEGIFHDECRWVKTGYIDDRSAEPFRHQRPLDWLKPGLVHWPQDRRGDGDGNGDGDCDEAILLRIVSCNPGEARIWLAGVAGWTEDRTNAVLEGLRRRKVIRIRRVGRAVCVYPE